MLKTSDGSGDANSAAGPSYLVARLAFRGGKDWFRSDTEYVMCFKGPGELPWANNTPMGHPPKWEPGGEMSYRITNGTRINEGVNEMYDPPTLANPGNVIPRRMGEPPRTTLSRLG
jgi:hypothetical protein